MNTNLTEEIWRTDPLWRTDTNVILLDVHREQRASLNAANKIMGEQLNALVLAYSALLHAAEALTYHHALAFERDGKPVSERIAAAICAIKGTKL